MTLGNNTVYGSAENDIIIFGASDDTVFGGLGNDQLFGGDGRDRLNENEGHAHWPGGPDGHPLIEQARAALTEPDGPAVQSREPASVVGEPSDAELLKLMPEQFREDLATVSRMAAHGAGTGVTPGLFRVSLNTGALDYARAVCQRLYDNLPARIICLSAHA